MRMSHAAMYARLLESDASYNGRFFTGVLTTGIYCLPACKARKPKPENVRFFPSCEAARAAGLRPCKKCRPDDFSRGADPILADIETLVAEIRSAPDKFPDARAIVRRSGFGTTRLFELFRQHYHATPADVLLRSRLAVAKRHLLGTDARLLDIAHAAGFDSVSVFHEHFRSCHGLTPSAYRQLREELEFQMTLPAGYPHAYLRRALSRDPQSLVERLVGDHYVTAVQLPGGAARLTLQFAGDAVNVAVTPSSPRSPRSALPAGVAAHAIVVGILGLEQDAAAFSRLARKFGLARLVAGRSELRIVQTPSIFDGLLWSIIGQQINFPFACTLKRRLIERTGTPLGDGLFAPPLPEAVAALSIDDLLPLQFSRQKAEYVTSIARLIVARKLNLDELRLMSATRAERTLVAVRGLGPWSVNYLMMRSLGFADCVPLGDTGVTSGLQALLDLEERPDVRATRRLMTIFSPYRSLATAHLWQFTQPPPT